MLLRIATYMMHISYKWVSIINLCEQYSRVFAW
jgi:hypothetical protein